MNELPSFGGVSEAVSSIANVAGSIADGIASLGFALASKGTMSPAEYNQMTADLVNYLVFMAEPFKQHDKQLGLLVLAFLGLLLVLTYYLKKEFWKDIH